MKKGLKFLGIALLGALTLTSCGEGDFGEKEAKEKAASYNQVEQLQYKSNLEAISEERNTYGIETAKEEEAKVAVGIWETKLVGSPEYYTAALNGLNEAKLTVLIENLRSPFAGNEEKQAEAVTFSYDKDSDAMTVTCMGSMTWYDNYGVALHVALTYNSLGLPTNVSFACSVVGDVDADGNYLTQYSRVLQAELSWAK